ncbi:hypothetical protein GBS1173_0845 [Streptococcus agalactiae CF01173]|nr:hypothetical protein GBS1173_0845 [Streptococcus agalactiae CF01173]
MIAFISLSQKIKKTIPIFLLTNKNINYILFLLLFNGIY